MSDAKIIQRLHELGIDHARLKGCLDAKDNWGALINSFEYLTVLGVVEQVMSEAETVSDSWQRTAQAVLDGREQERLEELNE